MRLTGIPLILLAAAATIAAGGVGVLLWRRGGRLRPVTRTLSILVLEALVVLTAGLVVNRNEQFYPSWTALAGDVGTVAVTDDVRAGRLDDRLPAGGGALTWRPAGLARWHLAGPPTLVLPADYRDHPADTFPVLLDLTAAGPETLPGTVVVILDPTAATTASALRTLPAELRRDVRVSATGWAVTGSGPLAAAIAQSGLAVAGRSPDALPPPLAAPMRLPS